MGGFDNLVSQKRVGLDKSSHNLYPIKGSIDQNKTTSVDLEIGH